MKKLVLIFLLIINTKAFAQREEAFYCKDSADMNNIVSLAIENTQNKYHLDTIIHHRQDVEIWYRNEAHRLLRFHFKLLPDRTAILVTLTGEYEDIYFFWKKYFEEDADIEGVKKAKQGKLVSKPFLLGKVEFSFRKGGDVWQLKTWYGPDSKK